MTRDQKIGFAMGILLVGAVAAFFFRHEETGQAPLPALKSAADLDQQISNGARAPYLEPRLPDPPRPSPTDPLIPVSEEESSHLVPDPIAFAPLEPIGSGTQLASSSQSLSHRSDFRSQNMSGSNSSAPRLHTVKRGDTLSSIAAEYLGSAARFDDIYQANRDQLRDANDLKIGQQLRIPTEAYHSTPTGIPAPVETTSPPEIAPERPGPPSAPSPPGRTLKFVPYPGNRAPARTADPADGKKRLSQLPPEDVIIRR